MCLEYNILDTELAPPPPLQLRPRACKRASAGPACLCTLHEVLPATDALARRAKAPAEKGGRAARRGGGGGAGGGGPAPETQPRAPRPSHGPCECSWPASGPPAGGMGQGGGPKWVSRKGGAAETLSLQRVNYVCKLCVNFYWVVAVNFSQTLCKQLNLVYKF